eukprot:10025940-Karenia_brevis.AAC.1
MCSYGMQSKDQWGEGLVLKPTSFLTNSPFIAAALDRQCSNKYGRAAWHRHITLMNNRAKACQVYPYELCRTICDGLKQQKAADQESQYLLSVVDLKEFEGMSANKAQGLLVAELNEIVKHQWKEIPPEEVEEGSWTRYWDEVSGHELETWRVEVARKTEMKYIKEMKLYDVVPMAECLRKTCRKPIQGRWLDVNKGDLQNPLYRSRYVAKEFRKGVMPELFAATPPLEGLRILLSLLATNPGKEQLRFMTMDVSRAFFHAPATRELYVELPEEEGLDKNTWCAKLNYSLYGTRDAPLNWALTYGNHLRSLGFRSGKASPCIFWHKEKNLRVLVHGDDYACAGTLQELYWLEEMMKKKFEVKTQYLGPEAHCQQEIRFLSRIIRWTSAGIQYEADPRHQEII